MEKVRGQNLEGTFQEFSGEAEPDADSLCKSLRYAFIPPEQEPVGTELESSIKTRRSHYLALKESYEDTNETL